MDALDRFLDRRPMPAAVVAGVDTTQALAAIRALADAGAPVIALDHRPGALGFSSRFAFPALCPDPELEPELFTSFLLRLADVLGRPAPVFPETDAYRRALAEREELHDRFLVHVQGEEGSLRSAYWKLLGAQLSAAPGNGVPRRFALGRLDPGPRLARLLRFTRGRGP